MIQQFDSDDTIVALATAREPGYPQAIIRVSGKATQAILAKSFSSSGPSGLEDCRVPRRFNGEFFCSGLSAPIPIAMLFWPTVKSYTGQVSAEIHAPGSLPLLEAMLEQLCRNGARLAEPGEFTLRAFLGGRIDLTEAEAVLGVIDAKDRSHLNVALRQLSGGLSEPIHHSRNDLLNALAHLEAGLDFVEEDIEFVSQEQLLHEISKCEKDLDLLKSQLGSRDQVESEFRIVLFGQPNTGKSSLFNVLVRRYGKSLQSAIVTPVSGTTRDFISAPITIGGREITLIDTAGVEWEESTSNHTSGPTDDNEEQLSPLNLGQQKSESQRRESSLILFCLDSTRPLLPWEVKYLSEIDSRSIVCLTKADLVTSKISLPGKVGLLGMPISSKTETGMDALTERIAEFANANELGESLPSTATRCRSAVDEALARLASARQIAEQAAGEELVAAEIRLALDSIGKITGVVYTDDILDVVFKQFCIGK